ncbi:MAG: hypothetical protein KAG66_00260 [Methylococcales bacterium]|nr:hypothetical protein [Methylococcales bacterium]
MNKSQFLGISFSSMSVLLLFFLVQIVRNPACETTFFLNGNQPQDIADEIIAKFGGLPKRSVDVDRALSLISLPEIYPVDDWQVKSSSMINSQSLLKMVFDDDPVYSYDFDIQATYADGETAVFHYTSWRYGIAACPFALSMGDGPNGTLQRR